MQSYHQCDLYFAKFRILQLLLESWFSVFKRDFGNFQLFLISRSIITISKLYKNVAVKAILRKICNLRNLVFYKFSQNLGFQPLGKGLTTLQLVPILCEIIIISKVLRKNTARAVWRKICILRNFAFYNFSENLSFQS